MAERGAPAPGWSDGRLVKLCLKGDEEAWGALVDKYKAFIYSIVRRYGASPDAATDLFQGIWLDVYNDLPKLQSHDALKGWLGTLTARKCFHWKQQLIRQGRAEAEVSPQALEQVKDVAPDLVESLGREQIVREATFRLPRRCRELVRLLFFSFPPRPYKEVAEELGLALGSIGFVRGRCLEKLKRNLEELGL
jgi:RNA polymerase sigma factor (sigma-70 family)